MKKVRKKTEVSIDRPKLVDGGRVTHVLVPIDEYKQLIAESLVPEALSKLTSETANWTSARQVGLRLAGKRIAAARRNRGLTQKAVSKRLGISQSEVSRIENSPDNTTLKTLRRIAKALEVDVRALI